jgi:Fur family transcriptional regulator, ferric uptake regulator
MKPTEIKRHVQHCIEHLRQRGARRTRALELVIEELARRGKPVTLAELANSAAIKVQCDPATVYRLVMKLEEHGLVRRLGLHERSSYFMLVITGHHHDYLVCTECGKMEEIDMACPVHALEAQLEKSSGYKRIYHELEFFGICPTCLPHAQPA